MPIGLYGHQVNVLNDSIIVTGGCNTDEGDYQNKVWEGSISFYPKFHVNWTQLPPMIEKRTFHVAVVINNTLYCLGGYKGFDHLRSSEYLSEDKKRWESGPKLHCRLSNAKGVVDEASQKCFITGGTRDGKKSNKISLFHPSNGLKDINELDNPFYDHIALML